jgi:hypothetical protein
MKKFLSILLLVILTAFLFQTCKKDDLKNLDCSTIAATYSANIKPLVTTQCATSSSCHGAGTTRSDYSTYAGLKSVADDGSLEKKVLKDKSMPPSGALSLDQRRQIKCWLNNGSQNN